MRKFSVFVIVGAVAALSGGAAFAQTWNEVGDAPAGVPDRQDTIGVGPLTHIVGATGASDWVDTYSIIITDPAAFYATTANTVGFGTGAASFDTRMWLWTNSGEILLGNDDTFSDALQSTISDPSTFAALTGGAVNPTAAGISLAAGEMYLLSISGFSEDPEDAVGSDIITLSGLFSELHGPNVGVGPFAAWEMVGAQGEYTIELGGATFYEVPEPGTLGVLALGGIALLRRRRRT